MDFGLARTGAPRLLDQARELRRERRLVDAYRTLRKAIESARRDTTDEGTRVGVAAHREAAECLRDLADTQAAHPEFPSGANFSAADALDVLAAEHDMRADELHAGR